MDFRVKIAIKPVGRIKLVVERGYIPNGMGRGRYIVSTDIYSLTGMEIYVQLFYYQVFVLLIPPTGLLIFLEAVFVFLQAYTIDKGNFSINITFKKL